MTVGGDTPYDARLEVSTEWSTGLKAFETSRMRTPMARPASRALCQSFVVLNRMVDVEYLGWNTDLSG